MLICFEYPNTFNQAFLTSSHFSCKCFYSRKIYHLLSSNGWLPIHSKVKYQTKYRKRRKLYLEILLEARSPVRPSSVTTSNPILSVPSLISPSPKSDKEIRTSHKSKPAFKAYRFWDSFKIDNLHITKELRYLPNQLQIQHFHQGLKIRSKHTKRPRVQQKSNFNHV